MTLSQLKEQLSAYNISATTMDGYDEAIIGYSTEILEDDEENLKTSTVYSYSKCIGTLMSRDGMSKDEAVEYFEFNTLRALMYLQEPTKPIIVIDEVA